jgi:MOB kinase activator 1
MKRIFRVSVFKRQRSGTTINTSSPTSKNGEVQVLTLDNSGLGMSDEQLLFSVRKPPTETLPEWLAHHVVDFSNNMSLLVNTIQPCCTSISCPHMSAGPTREYRWLDKTNEKYQKATAVSAPEYMGLLFDWINMQIEDERIFPVSETTPFPKDFVKIVQKIFSRLFRVFVHMYYHHYDEIRKRGSSAHLNTIFKHFLFFSFEFKLLDKAELEPMNEIIVQLLGPSYKRFLNYKEGSKELKISVF